MLWKAIGMLGCPQARMRGAAEPVDHVRQQVDLVGAGALGVQVLALG